MQPIETLRYPLLALSTTVLLCAGCQQRPQPATENAASAASEPADALPPGEITTPTGVPLILIPAGEFVMGGGQESDSTPVHKVRVDAFYMDRYEVTQELYQRFMKQNPSRHAGAKNPVERVRWTDAIKFCNIRSQEEGLTPCYNLTTWTCDFAADGYRLPTEAQWEYACRARSASDFYFPGGSKQLDNYAWFKENSRRKHQPVGQKLPNDFRVV